MHMRIDQPGKQHQVAEVVHDRCARCGSGLAHRLDASFFDDHRCRRAVQTERSALFLADGGCTLPFGAWCTSGTDGALSLVAALGMEDGSVARAVATGTDPESVAAAAWSELCHGVHA